MKKLMLLLFLTPLITHAEEDAKRVRQIYRTNSEVDAKLSKSESVYTFQFNPTRTFEEPIEPLSIQYSIDGKMGTQRLKNKSITIKSTPGKHIFQFFYDQNHFEVYSDSLKIKPQHHDTYRVQLIQATETIMTEKPVIYLYPQASTQVKVELNIHGENPFYYPNYADSWEFTAEPNGDLQFGEDTYNYLFWEASTRTILSPKQIASGFFVEGSNAVHFFEDKLTEAGLNSKEKADFITYWGPRLAQNKLNFVHFVFNEECNEFADLSISPTPDKVYRIYIIWGAVSEEFQVDEQQIESFDRSGFSVLEWGGKESPIRKVLP